jgi:hypothetical protein
MPSVLIAPGWIVTVEGLAARALHHRIRHLRRQLLAALPHGVFLRGPIALFGIFWRCGLPLEIKEEMTKSSLGDEVTGVPYWPRVSRFHHYFIVFGGVVGCRRDRPRPSALKVEDEPF